MSNTQLSPCYNCNYHCEETQEPSNSLPLVVTGEGCCCCDQSSNSSHNHTNNTSVSKMTDNSSDTTIDDTMGPSSRFHGTHSDDVQQLNSTTHSNMPTPSTSGVAFSTIGESGVHTPVSNRNYYTRTPPRISQTLQTPYILTSDPSSLMRIVMHGRRHNESRPLSKRCSECFLPFGIFKSKHVCVVCTKMFCDHCCLKKYQINLLDKILRRLCEPCRKNLIRLGFTVKTDQELPNQKQKYSRKSVRKIGTNYMSAPPIYSRDNTPVTASNESPPRYITFSGIPEGVSISRRYFENSLTNTEARFMNNPLRLPPIITNQMKRIKIKNILKEESSLNSLDENNEVTFILNKYLIMKVFKRCIDSEIYYTFITDGMNRATLDNMWTIFKYNGQNQAGFIKFMSLIILEIFDRSTVGEEFKEYKYYPIEDDFQKLIDHDVKYSGYLGVKYFNRNELLGFKIANKYPYYALVFLYKREESLVKVIPLLILAQIANHQQKQAATPLPIINDTNRDVVEYCSLSYHVQIYQGLCDNVRFNPNIGIKAEICGNTITLTFSDHQKKNTMNVLNDLKKEQVICLSTALGDNSNSILLPPRQNIQGAAQSNVFYHFDAINEIRENLANKYALNFVSLSLKNTRGLQSAFNWSNLLNHPNQTICMLFHGGIYIHLRTEDYDNLLHYFKVHNENHKLYIKIATDEHHYKNIINAHINTMLIQMDCREYDVIDRHFMSPVDNKSYYRRPMMQFSRRYEFANNSPCARLVLLFGVLVTMNNTHSTHEIAQHIKYIGSFITNTARDIVRGVGRENKIINLSEQNYKIIATRITAEREQLGDADKEVILTFYSEGSIIGYENFRSHAFRSNFKLIKRYLIAIEDFALDIVVEVSRII